MKELNGGRSQGVGMKELKGEISCREEVAKGKKELKRERR